MAEKDDFDLKEYKGHGTCGTFFLAEKNNKIHGCKVNYADWSYFRKAEEKSIIEHSALQSMKNVEGVPETYGIIKDFKKTFSEMGLSRFGSIFDITDVMYAMPPGYDFENGINFVDPIFIEPIEYDFQLPRIISTERMGSSDISLSNKHNARLNKILESAFDRGYTFPTEGDYLVKGDEIYVIDWGNVVPLKDISEQERKGFYEKGKELLKKIEFYYTK